MINRMQEMAKIPLLMSLDAETGIGMRFEDATNFPWAMAVGATGNPEYARRIGVIAGREAKAIGIQHVYAPVLDVNNNRRQSRDQRPLASAKTHRLSRNLGPHSSTAFKVSM